MSKTDFVKRLQDELAVARRVIVMYRRWEHASDSDDEDHSEMLIEASFAAQDYMERFQQQVKPLTDTDAGRDDE